LSDSLSRIIAASQLIASQDNYMINWLPTTILGRESDKSTRWIRGSTYSERGTTILEPGRGQLHAKSHIPLISCHVTCLSWQEPKEELNKFLLIKVSGDLNVKVKMFVVCAVIVSL